MINLTPDAIVFNAAGDELNVRIKLCLESAARQHLLLTGLQNIQLEAVTTKTYIRATFAKFVIGRVLRDKYKEFDKAYVVNSLAAYKAKNGYLTKELFQQLLAADEHGPYGYKRSYAVHIKSGFGLFLLALHSCDAITLPSTFRWPTIQKQDGQSTEINTYLTSELLSFVRSFDPYSDSVPHPAFEVIGGDKTRRRWFLYYATKLLLATGWHKAEDVNVADLIKIKKAERIINENNSVPFAYRALLDVLNIAFPKRVAATSKDWTDALKLDIPEVLRAVGRSSAKGRIVRHLLEDGPRSDHDLLEEVLLINAAWGKPERLRTLSRLPGLDIDMQAISKVWLDMEELYVLKVNRESYKHYHTAIGWWNIYLFYYLPYWYCRYKDDFRTFPSSPSKLLKSMFVSRMLPAKGEVPATFVEYVNIQAERRGWAGNSFYSTLMQLQGFFAFVERYSDEIPGCEGFVQPLSPHDFPRTSRPKNTAKRPVPRRLFGALLAYYESLIAYHAVVVNRIIEGGIADSGVKRLESNVHIIDTFATGNIVGFIPIIFVQGKTLPLQFIPNVLDLRRRSIQGGNYLFLPHPHALHQNLVALHTGLRHNHIQWLDKDNFDCLVDANDTEFSNLYVNTDKQKTKPWAPYVSFRVVEILRNQRQWCDLVEEPNFHAEHFYNNNPSTKWAKFKPLFAYTADGRPHPDDLYSDVWKSVLATFQELIFELPEFSKTRRLVHLLPPGFRPNEVGREAKLTAYGAAFTQMGQHCPLRICTESTPHSARVAVVSQYITFLPADLVGKYVTGQKAGTVVYYVHLEPEDLEIHRVRQAARMREAVLKGAFEPILRGEGASSTFLHADSVNSSLARSIRANLEETITTHGGMCITFNERNAHGMDVLRETGCAGIAFNKTEICPYGNNCPPDIVKELKGIRRCSLCSYAVRFVDHLPAVLAKKRQVADAVDALEGAFAVDARTLNSRYTAEELDTLEADKARLCEDLSGWILIEEVLEIIRQRIAAGRDTRRWTVQRPEIVEHDLRRVTVQTTESEYLLARLGESIAFPTLESPQMRARFDLLLRELLALAGNIGEAFSIQSVDPAIECAGMLKAIADSRGLTLAQIADLLDRTSYIQELPKSQLRLLSEEGVRELDERK